MSLFHAVVWIDHHRAQVLQFHADDVREQRVKSHYHYTRQHHSSVRSEHDFFGEVCDALAGVTEVLVTGSHLAQTDFRHYLEKHRALLSRQVVGWETVDHPAKGELLAFAKRYFERHDRMAAAPPSPG